MSLLGGPDWAVLAWWEDPEPGYDLANLSYDAETYESLKPAGQVLAAMNPDLRRRTPSPTDLRCGKPSEQNWPMASLASS
jgi:hypothetical protein